MKITILHFARIVTAMVFLAFIRSASEIYRLQYFNTITITIVDVLPFVHAMFLCSIALAAMFVLGIYNKNKWVIAVGIAAILGMFTIKYLLL